MELINKPAPQPTLETWAQGSEPNISELRGQVILIEVIQVNCPGCFVHALPEVIRLHEEYACQGLKVFAIATAFEHFEHNTLNNLQRLLQDGELIGDPLSQLGKTGFLENNKLPYTIPFSVAMDKLVKTDNQVSENDINAFIISQIPDFFKRQQTEAYKQSIYQQAETHLNNKQFNALTFEMFKLQGTPSTILIDKQGILRKVSFGAINRLDNDIENLLNKPAASPI